MYKPLTLRQRCMNETYGIARGNFLDDFKRSPLYDLIEESVLDLDNLNEVQKAELAATVDEMCSKFKVKRPDWIFDPSTYLKEPHFAMNAKGPLRVILLQESPKWYRSRNLFVSANCSERV